MNIYVGMEELWKEFNELKVQSQEKYLKYRDANDPPFSKLNTEIEVVFTTKRKQKISKMYEAFYENGLIDKRLKEIGDKIENLQKSHRKEGKTLNYWITVNPPEETTLEEMLKHTNRFINRAIVEEYMYVVEQRGAIESEIGKGKHIHLYFKIKEETYEPPSKIIKYLKSSYKKLLNVETKALWIQPLKQEYVIDKVNYMIDKNIDGQYEDKKEKQQMDKIFRENNNLLNYYTSIDAEKLLNMISVVEDT